MKFGSLTFKFHRRPNLKFARGTRPFALHLHGVFEAGEIHIETTLACDVSGQIKRKTKGIVQTEHGFAVKNAITAAATHRTIQHAHAMLQRLSEFFFFLF